MEHVITMPHSRSESNDGAPSPKNKSVNPLKKSRLLNLFLYIIQSYSKIEITQND